MNAASSQPARTWPAALFLFIAATVIPEVLIGSTPLSRLNTLVFQFPLYGSAALLIRELVIRFRLGFAGLLVLGLAYGVTIEGLALQSLFNPHFLNLDISFGRTAGVNWPWALYMVGYHALWSMTVPIMLAELLFPQRAGAPWLGKAGLGIFTGLLLLMVAAFRAIFVRMSGFQAPVLNYAGAAAAVVAFAFAGLRLKRGSAAPAAAPAARYLPGLFAFLLGLLWLGLYGDIFHHPHLLPAAANLGVGIAVAAVFLLVNRSHAAWSPRHRFSFVAGALCTNTLFGFVVVSASGSALDLYGQCAFLLLVGVGLVALGRKVAKTIPT